MAQDVQIICPQLDKCKEITPALIKHILVPFDGSDISYHAFEFALDLAKKYNAKISILTIILSSVLSSSFSEMASHQKVIQQKQVAQVDHLFKTLHNNAKKFKIYLNSNVIFATNVGDSLISFCAHQKVNLIVMGTRARPGPKGFLIGSVAMDIIQKTSCPVILVK